MALDLPVPVQYRGENAHIEPQFPLGTWFAEGNLVSAGEGDPFSITIVFQNSTQALISLGFSLEQMWARRSDTTATRVHANIRNIGVFSFTRQFSLNLSTDSSGGGGNTMPLDTSGFLPIYLGYITERDTQADIEFVSPDPGTGDSIRFQAEGYYWGDRSRLAPGGPQRPPFGIYGK